MNLSDVFFLLLTMSLATSSSKTKTAHWLIGSIVGAFRHLKVLRNGAFVDWLNSGHVWTAFSSAPRGPFFSCRRRRMVLEPSPKPCQNESFSRGRSTHFGVSLPHFKSVVASDGSLPRLSGNRLGVCCSPGLLPAQSKTTATDHLFASLEKEKRNHMVLSSKGRTVHPNPGVQISNFVAPSSSMTSDLPANGKSSWMLLL
jgi:hypothetical protein